jgi:predicted NUDIX family NTP pyrophosphohydrolase
MANRVSAALLLYRLDPLEVLIGHMGGPFWARKDAGAWSIPKGELDPDEDPHAAALREFAEELGVPAPEPADGAADLELGEVRQKSGKRVVAWARRADLDVTRIASNTATIEWPPRSGRTIEVPELDRAAWFAPAEARARLVPGQQALIDRLQSTLPQPDDT